MRREYRDRNEHRKAFRPIELLLVHVSFSLAAQILCAAGGSRVGGAGQLDDFLRDGEGRIAGEALQAQLRDRQDRNLSGSG